ncbi:MAG TPA: HNH endonuclease [Terriglobales bacterium]|nr:HNH endonuclease [Terriglobales bacterium]
MLVDRTCIFCAADRRLTDEHVIPASLGGDLVIAGGSCATCNNRCSHEFEAAFINNLLVVRHLLGIANRAGKIPSVPVTFPIRGASATGVLTPEHEFCPNDTVIKAAAPEQDEYWMFTGRGRRKLERHAEQSGKRIVPLDPTECFVAVRPRSSIELNFVTEESAKRAVAKVAYAYAIHCLGRLPQRSAAYDAVRRFIIHGEGRSPTRLFFNRDFLTATNLTGFQHALLLSSDSQKHAVTAIVVLFGGLNYVVRLADEAFVDVGCTYIWDSRKRKPIGFFTRDYLHEHAGVDIIDKGSTVFDDVAQVAEHWKGLLESAGRIRAAEVADPKKKP